MFHFRFAVVYRPYRTYSTNHVYLHRFSRLRFCVAFYFETDFNLRFKRKRDVRQWCACVVLCMAAIVQLIICSI